MTTESQEPIKTITLEHPFKFGDENISQILILRRPKAKDLKGLNMQAMQAEDVCKLLGKISNLSTPQIEEIDLADFNSLGEAMKDFLPNTLEGGKPI